MIRDLIELAKPRITALVIATTGVGLYLAPGPVSAGRVLMTLVGTVLMVAGANVLNMYLERDSDRLMERTRDRPLPAGRMNPRIALWYGILMAVVSVLILSLGVNLISGTLALFSFVVYVLAYTPLKKHTDAALQIGGVSGAMPPVIGWAAVTGRVELPALVLFAIMFLWQVPHFLAIALFRKGDYARAGIKIYPLERGEPAARLAIIRYTLALVLVSLFLYPLHIAGTNYLLSTLLLGGLFLGWGLLGIKKSTLAWARGLFLISLFYLTALFGVLVLDAQTPLPVLATLPPFQLVDQTNHPLGRADLKNRVWVADFIFTSCAEVCPLLTQRMKGLQDWITSEKLSEVSLVSFSVDPETDTPKRLADYADKIQARSDLWHFVTGPYEQIEAAVMQGFKISMGRVPVTGARGFDVVHGDRFVLVDRQGQIRGYYESNEQGLALLKKNIMQLLHGGL